MKASYRFPVLIAALVACTLAPAQFQGSYYALVNLPIPSSGTGGAGACGVGNPNTTAFTLSVPDAFVVSHVSVDLSMSHTYVGDLTITLSHCGTSVALYDRSPGSPSDLNGTYSFDDQASLAFSSYVTIVPVVPPNSYLPVNPFTPFFGMSSGGDWTISICDHASNDVGQLSSINLTLVGLQSYGGSVNPALAIPDGYSGCIAPVARAINVSNSGIVDQVNVSVGLTHNFVQDLHVTLAHDGVVVPLILPGSIHPFIGMQGIYTFTDSTAFVQPLTLLANFLPPGSTLPTGLYNPASPLSAFVGHSKQGVWLLTVCDNAQQDTGTLTHASLVLSNSAWDLTVSQPNGPLSLVFQNSGGIPGHTFLNLATVVPGSFPNGWLNGLDISIPDVVAELSLGPPIIGALGTCGAAITSIPGPIPSNLPIQLVSFELDATGTPVASKHAFQYVTQ